MPPPLWSLPLYQGENPGQGLLSRCPDGLVVPPAGLRPQGARLCTPGGFQAALHRGVCASAFRFPLQLLLGTVRSHL